jgi:ACS family hexuronate transporter-like MFS transporter
MGATVGAALTPHVVIPLATFDYAQGWLFFDSWFGREAGWRVAFLLTGLAGFLWLGPWLVLYRRPGESRLITVNEAQLIGEEESAAAGKAWSWKEICSFRPVWLLLIGRLLTDPVWYFYQFWFAKFLGSERGLDQQSLTITWVVYAAAGVGSLAGGWFSGLLVKRGKSPLAARLAIMAACACVMPLSFLITRATGLPSTMVLTACTVFASLAWLINISAIVVDVVPKHSLGSAFSVVAAGSTLGGMAMNMIVAAMVSGPAAKPAGFLDQGFKAVFGPLIGMVEGKGYEPWFLIMAFLHPLALALLWFGGLGRWNKRVDKPIS